MGPASKSLLLSLVTAIAVVGSASPPQHASSPTFGRFGYGAIPAIPGWDVDAKGFRPRHSLSDAILFPRAAAQWIPTVVSSRQEAVELGAAGEGGPSRLRFDLDAPGFSMWFDQGVDLRLTSTAAPYLSWPEGTVAQTVPTPTVPWVLVSYSTEQPPILFAFEGGPQAMVVTGSPGDWRLRTTATYQGWMRVVLPTGMSPAAPRTASGLGELSAKVAANADIWSGGSPQLQGLTYEADATSLTATWTYDKPGALVPSAALLATYGGYPVRILSEILRLDGAPDEGPTAVTRESKLTLRFLIRPVPAWRYMAIGSSAGPSVAAKMTVPAATDLAFSVLCSDANKQAAANAGQALINFLGAAGNTVEPLTGLKLPFAQDGTRFDAAAAHALLTQAIASANGTPDLPNPLLDAVIARVDAYTWRPWNMEEAVARRGAALASIALAMRTAPEDRLRGAMLQAGLSAQRGFDAWQRWRADTIKPPERLEALEGLRKRIFSLEGSVPIEPEWDQLFSPIRSFVNFPVSLQNSNGKLMLTWMCLAPGAGEIGLYSLIPLRAGAGLNLSEASATTQGDAFVIRFRPRDVGACALELVLPDGSLPLLPATPLKYAEGQR